MTVGEKIRYYRELRGLSQQQFSELTGISVGVLQKYETSFRNPKKEPLQKIASALQISINVFSEFEVNSAQDIVPYLFAIAQNEDVHFQGKKADDGTYDPNEITLSFSSPALKNFLKAWADNKAVTDQLRETARNTSDTVTSAFLMHRADQLEQEFRLSALAPQTSA